MFNALRNTSILPRNLDPNNTDIGTPISMNATGHTAVNWVFTAAASGEYSFLFEAVEDNAACRFFIYDVKITHVGQVLDCEGVEGSRFGFQGQEKDDEIKGAGNSVNYTYRMHDPRLGRFFAVDPLSVKYPHYTPYSFSGNKGIHAVELEGLEEFQISDAVNPVNGSKLKKLTITNVSAPFRILDETGAEINNFKYECFQMMMCGRIFSPVEVSKHGIGPRLELPNKPGQKIFNEVLNGQFVGFKIEIDDFTPVEPIFADQPKYEDFFEIVNQNTNSKSFTAPLSSTDVNYDLGYSYTEQGAFEGIFVQITGSDGRILANSNNGSLNFSVRSGEQFTITVNRGTATLGAEFRFYGLEITTEQKDVTESNCEEFKCGN